MGGAWDSQGSGEFTRVAFISVSPVREAIAVPTMAACLRQVLRKFCSRVTGKAYRQFAMFMAGGLSAFLTACARDIAGKDNILQVRACFEAESLGGKRAMQSGCLFDDNCPASMHIAVNVAGDDR